MLKYTGQWFSKICCSENFKKVVVSVRDSYLSVVKLLEMGTVKSCELWFKMKIKTKSLRVAIALLLCCFCYAEGMDNDNSLSNNFFYVGEYFTPIAFTFPDGLQSVNGSSSTGGCQPESCVMMPISGTTNGCDCPGTTPASGFLIVESYPTLIQHKVGHGPVNCLQ